MVLFAVVGILFVVVLLANVVLNIMLSQSRLTHHQVSRIQGYYAAMAGTNYAYDKLRRQDDTTNWPIPAASSSYTRTLCRSGCDINDADLPKSVNNVSIKVSGAGASGCNPPTGVPACVSATADYTYE